MYQCMYGFSDNNGVVLAWNRRKNVSCTFQLIQSSLVPCELRIFFHVQLRENSVIVVQLLRVQLVGGADLLQLLLESLDVHLQLYLQFVILVSAAGNQIFHLFCHVVSC